MGRTMGQNNVTLCGDVAEEFKFSHEICGNKFYVSTVASKRKSGTVDYVPITVSERLVEVNAAWSGQKVKLSGSFRSYRKRTETGKHLILTVFVDEIVCVGNDERDENEIYLDGYICKKVQYRETPLGREVSDILLAVNRAFEQSDYIPCITWGGNARFANSLYVGDRLSVYGRIQSREYQKKLDSGEVEKRIAYEASIGEIELIRGDEE